MNRFIKQLFFLLFIGFIANACTKKTSDGHPNHFDVVVEGFLFDVSNMEPIANGKVFVLRDLRQRLYIIPEYLETTTNENGYYRFEFKIDNEYAYQVISRTDDYYRHYGVHYNYLVNGNKPTSGGLILNYEAPKKDHFFFMIKLIPTATIKVRIVNVQKIYDRFGLNTPPGSPLGSGGSFFGMDVDETLYFTVFGAVDLKLDTFRYQPGEGPGEGEHVIIPFKATPHDVTEILIEY
jgi:hypothetical protein